MTYIRNPSARIVVFLALLLTAAGTSKVMADCESHEEGKLAYLANINDDAISVIDMGTMQIVDRITGFDSPYGVVVLPDDSKIYVDNAASLAPSK